MRDRVDVLLTCAAAGFACVAAGAAVSDGPAAGPPAAGVGESRPDLRVVGEPTFGTLGWGGSAETAVRLKNVSPHAIELLGVDTDCGCTVAELPDRLVPPGETAEVRVTYDAGRSDGPVTRRVTAVYRRAAAGRAADVGPDGRPAEPSPTHAVEVAVTGGVRPDYRFDPPELTLAAGEPRALRVRPVAAGSAKILAVVFDTPAVSAAPAGDGAWVVSRESGVGAGRLRTTATVTVSVSRGGGPEKTDFFFLPVLANGPAADAPDAPPATDGAPDADLHN